MIHNIIFDMAWVLFEYEPLEFTKNYVTDEADAGLINNELFCAAEWDLTDRGTLTDDEYLSIVLQRLPRRLHGPARYLFEHWHKALKPNERIESLICGLKKSGYKIYLLTNMSRRFYKFYKNIPAMKYFDGAIVSADEHTVKPEPEIYLNLFKKFNLKPEECFFIDDRPENIAAGEKLGMRGFCFRQDVNELAVALSGAGIKI